MKVTTTALRLLSFRLTHKEMLVFSNKDFYFGLFGTWIVGIGRWWDDPEATLLQHLGLGSVIYIFLLSAFIWAIVKPFKVEGWRYKTVLTFVSLTSFPAIFYAIPVEMFFDIKTANSLNFWFLAVVATWRLALLFFFLKRLTRLSIFNIVVVTLMPICLIISALATLNLHRAVFNIMGGIREPTSHDRAYAVLVTLTFISVILVIPLLIAYVTAIRLERRKARDKPRNS